MSNIQFRGMPLLPGLSRFPELNLRTYVTLNGKPGVYFFSLDAASRIAVWAARKFYHLPYFHARMSATVDGAWVNYESARANEEAEFRGRYRPTSPIELRSAGSLAHWLSDRYCLYTVSNGAVFRAEVHHPQWPLQDAEAEIQLNSVVSAAGLSLPSTSPLLHFSRRLEVLVWPLRRAASL